MHIHHLAILPVFFFYYVLPTIICVNHCGHLGVATVTEVSLVWLSEWSPQ